MFFSAGPPVTAAIMTTLRVRRAASETNTWWLCRKGIFIFIFFKKIFCNYIYADRICIYVSLTLSSVFLFLFFWRFCLWSFGGIQKNCRKILIYIEHRHSTKEYQDITFTPSCRDYRYKLSVFFGGHCFRNLLRFDQTLNRLWLHTSWVRVLSPDSVSSSLMGVERCDTEPSSSRSSSESSSDELLMASSLGGGGALAAVLRWSSVSSLLLLCLQSPNIGVASKTPGLELGLIFLTGLNDFMC